MEQLPDYPLLDSDVIRVMVNGGLQLCDYAIAKWESDAYRMGHAECRRHIRLWNAKKSRIRDLARKLKNA